MRVRGVDFVSVCVPEGRMDEAKAFYGGVLELQPDEIAVDGWVEYRAGNLTIGLDSEPYMPPAHRGLPGGEVRIALAVEDLDAAVAELRQDGIEPEFGPNEHEPCSVAGVRDPFGNLILLHRRKDGTAG